MPGRARGRTASQRLGGCGARVSMDARPSARADIVWAASTVTHSSRLNGCPAERAGGRRIPCLCRPLQSVSMDARPSARADKRTLGSGTTRSCLNGCPAERAGGPPLMTSIRPNCAAVSMDARPSARADDSQESHLCGMCSLNGCPAERAGGPFARIQKHSPRRGLNGCPAERAGGLAGWLERWSSLGLNGCPAERAGGPLALHPDAARWRRLNGCPAERAGGPAFRVIIGTFEASQWMPGRARGRTQRLVYQDLGHCVSMDARPSARADTLLLREAVYADGLNGCPAERAGGHDAFLVPIKMAPVSMDARPSARADVL